MSGLSAIFQVAVLPLSLLVLPSAEAMTLSALRGRAQACLQGRSLPICQAALLDAEALQQRASSIDAFPCQTRLLGLQAELIMVQLNKGRGANALKDWGKLDDECRGL